ncbi:MAG: hypothetical protein ALECFALPRED_003456 [Alectoria fallacina]|uniref:Uncharacterized protein n=1 Tax=Alectoria fallacina TaxID=1903189 RepID=A0A8H3FMG6_9LECA|nr:MAG: hypothetical protein ALECFALPRED_003456 [Alectoria fallacina]
MGNLCGKPSKENDPFSQPGRPVGSAPPLQSNPRASVPKISSQGQKLGGSSGGEGSDARSAAARAAEERAKANQPKGKLGRDLAKERAQTRTGTLENVSQDERRRRETDQKSQAISYN